MSLGMEDAEAAATDRQRLHDLLFEGHGTFGPQQTAEIMIKVVGPAGRQTLAQVTEMYKEERRQQRGPEDKPWTKFLLDRRFVHEH